jgi:hypothetical protein
MKTKKNNNGISRKAMTLALIFTVVSTLSYGQAKQREWPLLKQMKERILGRNEAQQLFHTAAYHEISNTAAGPVISRTIHTSTVEVIFEEQLEVESWMTEPFEGGFDRKLEVESWMTKPFETSLEETIEVEEWMTSPFEIALEEDILVETWMTAPFEDALEETLAVEDWMTTPFDVKDDQQVNDQQLFASRAL